MNILHSPTSKLQQGAVLVTSLIFLLVLTLVALTANQSSVLEARMSTNNIVINRAFESSEALRMGIDDLLDGHIYYNGWPTTFSGGSLSPSLFSVPTGISIANTGYSWGVENISGEDLYASSSLTTDATLAVDGNSDGDYADDVDQQASLTAFRVTSVAAPGAGTAQAAGYLGRGKSSAGGGGLVYFELRSTGQSAGGARKITASNYRYVIRQ